MPGYNSGRGRLRDHYMRLARTFENENRSGQENPGRPPSWGMWSLAVFKSSMRCALCRAGFVACCGDFEYACDFS